MQCLCVCHTKTSFPRKLTGKFRQTIWNDFIDAAKLKHPATETRAPFNTRDQSAHPTETTPTHPSQTPLLYHAYAEIQKS